MPAGRAGVPRGSAVAAEEAADPAHRLADPVLVLDEREADEAVAVRPEADSRRHCHARLPRGLAGQGRQPLDLERVRDLDLPARQLRSWTKRAPFIDSIAARTGWPRPPTRSARQRKPSASGGAAPTSTVSPPSSRRWKSRLTARPNRRVDAPGQAYVPSKLASSRLPIREWAKPTGEEPARLNVHA
jgi:hypothetical protein